MEVVEKEATKSNESIFSKNGEKCFSCKNGKLLKMFLRENSRNEKLTGRSKGTMRSGSTGPNVKRGAHIGMIIVFVANRNFQNNRR